MKFIKRFLVLSFTLCLLLSVTALCANSYTDIMSSSIAQYMISCQPSSALVIKDTTVISDALKSPNYIDGVFDLPRLSPKYFYDIPTDAEAGINGNQDDIDTLGVTLPRSVYPVLVIGGRDLAYGDSFAICVRSVDTKECLKVIKVLASGQVTHLSTHFSDCSSELFEDLMDNDAKCYDKQVTIYDSKLHKDSVIMPNYVVGYSSALTSFAGGVSPSETYSFGDIDYEFEGYYTTGSSITYPVKFNVGRADSAAGMLLMSKNAAVTYNPMSSEVITNTTLLEGSTSFSHKYKGIYTMFYEDAIVTCGVKDTKLNMSNSDTVLSSAKVITVEAGTPVDTSSAFNCNYTDSSRGPVINSTGDLILDDDYKIRYTGTTDKKYNVNVTGAAFCGANLHVATLDCKAPKDAYTVNLWYNDPVTGESTKYKELTREVGDKSDVSDKLPNSWTDWEFDYWCTDTECKTPLQADSFFGAATKDSVLNLYAKFKYVGGTYTVDFYNDATEETKTEVFEKRYQPILPKVSDRVGYLFKNWQIVDTIASTEGTVYNPDSFAPVKDKKYIFKTFWDVHGVILDVKPKKTEYYVNDYISKSDIVVTVQDSNDGTTRTLNTNEFTISPSKVTTEGTNQIVVTYTKTGSTGTFDVTGKAVAPTSIKAYYTGGSLTVGDAIPKSNIKVTVNYNNGTTKSASQSEFTISPSTVSNAGNNTITVTYQNLSTTVSVTGSKKTFTKDETSSTKDKTLQSISATYTGLTPYVGDIISAGSIHVVAKYSDNSSKTLSSTEFSFSPSYIKSAGSNVITVTYGGKSTTFTVEAKEKATVKEGTEDTKSNPKGTVSSGSTGVEIAKSSSSDKATVSDTEKSKNGKGTSQSYLNGANILHMGSLASDSSISNSTDIMSEIASAGSNATSLNIDLYNGAEGNDITGDMLKAIKDKKLTLYVRMVSPADNSTIAKWTISGKDLDDASYTINPNITIDKIAKGSETLYYMAIVNVTYPDCVTLDLYPEVSAYDSGKVVRLYECSIFRDNANLLTTVRWADEPTPLTVDIYKSNSWCLSDAPSVYMNGSSLESISEDTQETTVSENELEDITEDYEDDLAEDEDAFVFDDSEEFNETSEEERPSTLVSVLRVILFVSLFVLIIGVIVVVIIIIKQKNEARNSYNAEDEFEEEFEEPGDDEEYEVDDDEESYEE